jgi:hypothetical protein
MNHMTLDNILSFDERVIVLSDPAPGHLYTWNRSVTFQLWERVFGKPGLYTEVDIRTSSRDGFDYDTARKYALEWANE